MKKIIALILTVLCLSTFAVIPAAALEPSLLPVGGGQTVLTWKELTNVGTAVVLGVEYRDWQGLKFELVNEDGLDCVKYTKKSSGRYEPHNYMFYFRWYSYGTAADEVSPLLDGYYPTIDITKYKYMAVKYKVNESAASMGTITWEDSFLQERDLYSKWHYIAHKPRVIECPPANEWTVNVYDISSYLDEFKGTKDEEVSVQRSACTVGFEFYPLGNDASVVPDDAAMYIQYIAFFETEAEARDYNGEGIESAPATTKPDTTLPDTTKPEDTTKPSDTTGNDTTKPADSASDTAPAATEGGSNVGLYIGIAVAAVAVIAVVVVVLTKKKKK